MSLKTYQQKRQFDLTPEPKGGHALRQTRAPLRFVVQKHQASRLHYDFRLELDGVLKSWAVPNGPSLDPRDKRLAMMTEDHPYDYRTFEGVIPEGNYGAGRVIVWDEGFYWAQRKAGKSVNEKILHEELERGNLKFTLEGKKLKGEFALVKMQRASEENAWLLIKKKDTFSSEEDIRTKDLSVRSRRTISDFPDPKKSQPNTMGLIRSNKTHGQFLGKTNSDFDFGDVPRVPMPRGIKPMLATLTDEPFSREGWIFEIKWDGYRAIAEIDREVALYSRNNLNLKNRFAPVVEDLSKIKRKMVVDGEMVVLDAEGRPDFQLLQQYQELDVKGQVSGVGTLMYYVFDILYLDKYDLRNLPLIKRKDILKKVLPPLQRVRVSDHIESNGSAFFEEIKKLGLEGVIAKEAHSHYETGVRSKKWLKIKTHLRQEAIIAGFTAPRGSRKQLGALIMGVYKDGKLSYVGHTGGGFNQRTLHEVREKLEPLIQKESPFERPPKTNAPVTWVKPKLIAEVEFSSWTKDGIMRQPIFLGLREDKKPQEIKKERQEKMEEVVVEAEKASEELQGVMIGGNIVPITNPSKIYWPDEGYRKKELIDYYRKIAPVLLPYLKDHPQSLLRHPDGIVGKSFFQKDVANLNLPEWAQTFSLYSESRDKEVEYLLCQNEATLVYMANLGCIEINPWSSRKQNIENPDWLVLDLDPEDIGFGAVIETANVIRRILEDADIPSFPKTSGKTGIHIYIPLGVKYDFDQVVQFANLIAILAQQQLPEITSIERSPKQRQKKVYIDYLQNRRGQTLAAPYSLRPTPGALVATPLEWREVTKRLHPSQFTMKTIFRRLDKKDDIFTPVLGKGVDIAKALKRLNP